MMPDKQRTISCPLKFILNILRVKNVFIGFNVSGTGSIPTSSKIWPSRVMNNDIISRVDSLHILTFSSGETRLVVEPADSKRRRRDMCPLDENCGGELSVKEATITISQVSNLYIWMEEDI